MITNKQIIKLLSNSTSGANVSHRINALYYFLIMHSFRCYVDKNNPGYKWRGMKLHSSIFDKNFKALSGTIDVSDIDLLPRQKFFIKKAHDSFLHPKIDFDVPMMIHFAHFFHYRNPSEMECDEDANIDFLCKQLSWIRRPYIKNGYQILKDIGIMDTGEKCLDFNIKKPNWERIIDVKDRVRY